MFENRAQSRIFGRKMKEVKVGCSKMQYTELHNLKTLLRKTHRPNFDKTYQKPLRDKCMFKKYLPYSAGGTG
jgi:hypothetical protein